MSLVERASNPMPRLPVRPGLRKEMHVGSVPLTAMLGSRHLARTCQGCWPAQGPDSGVLRHGCALG